MNSSTRTSNRGLSAWALYDWANSAFPTVITTFVFATYFTKGIAADTVSGTAQWGQAMSLSALGVAILGPILGAIADRGGRRKPWIFAFTLVCIAASALLWTAKPDSSLVLRTLVIVGVANLAFEMAMVFYNAMLPDLAPKEKIGRWSGWAWGLGYMGGLACLAITLVAFVQTDTPLFGLDKDAAEHLRATGPMVAIWMAIFSLPLFFLTPDRPSQNISWTIAVKEGFSELHQTLKNVRQHIDIVKFLLARMFYTDGLNTLFAIGGIYAAGTFGFEFDELILFGIGMNVTAGIGAVLFSWLDDRAGSKLTILVSVSALTLLGLALLVVETKAQFWMCGLPLGLFVGPAQSASRTMMARMAPEELRTEMFGLFALSGKATAFLGPALLGWVTVLADSQRVGMATILVFFVVGLVMMLRVPDVRA